MTQAIGPCGSSIRELPREMLGNQLRRLALVKLWFEGVVGVKGLACPSIMISGVGVTGRLLGRLVAGLLAHERTGEADCEASPSGTEGGDKSSPASSVRTCLIVGLRPSPGLGEAGEG